MRVSARRQARNRSVKSRLRTLEKNYRALAAAGKPEEAAAALKAATSALDRAARRGTIPRGRADRKKSRLALHLRRVTAPSASAATAAAPAA